MDRTLSPDQFVLVTVLVKLGVMASIASLLSRFGAFKRLLYKNELSLKEKLMQAAARAKAIEGQPAGGAKA